MNGNKKLSLKQIAMSHYPVLILGPSGAGKSTLASKLHKLSMNGDSEFKSINIGAMSENLFDSLLFGHKKGAFTGADRNQVGFCESVNNGTLFLDEIGDLSIEMQGKLLELCDHQKFYKLGDPTIKKFKGRLIFATNKNLEQKVKKGEFREDLYYRLRFLQIELEPLRDLSNCVEIIYSECRKRKLVFTDKAWNALVNYTWPGNYRELKQTLAYLELYNQVIDIGQLPLWLKSSSEMIEIKSYQNAINSFEYSFLKKNYLKNKGKLNQTARNLEMNKVTLISKLKKYDIPNEYKKMTN